jgi:5,10-methylenetetrahydromethanopterin reductase
MRNSSREGRREPADAALIGDEDTVVGRLEELREAGVDEFLGMPFGRSTEEKVWTRAFLLTQHQDQRRAAPQPQG